MVRHRALKRFKVVCMRCKALYRCSAFYTMYMLVVAATVLYGLSSPPSSPHCLQRCGQRSSGCGGGRVFFSGQKFNNFRRVLIGWLDARSYCTDHTHRICRWRYLLNANCIQTGCRASVRPSVRPFIRFTTQIYRDCFAGGFVLWEFARIDLASPTALQLIPRAELVQNGGQQSNKNSPDPTFTPEK